MKMSETKAKLDIKALVTKKNLLYIAGGSILLIVAILLIINYLKGTPVPVEEAKTRVTNQLESLKLSGSIIHRTNVLKMYDADGKVFNTVTTETWEDNDTDKFKQIIKYQDATVTKAFDGIFEYDYDNKSKTLKKTEVVNTSNAELKKRGYRVEAINWFNEILRGEQVTAVENRVDGKDVFIVTVIKNKDDKYVHYFDKESLNLVNTKIYKIKDGKDLLYQENSDQVFELINPNSEEERAAFFQFDVELPSDVKLVESRIDAVTRKKIVE